MSFENLDGWRRSARLPATFYQKTKGIKDFGFRDQLTRSGLSVPSNIAEGIERDRNAEMARFLTIAKGSAGEARTQIYIGVELGYLDRAEGQQWIQELKEISAMLGALIRKHRSIPSAVTNFQPNTNVVALTGWWW